jgi:hypothetical protein
MQVKIQMASMSFYNRNRELVYGLGILTLSLR